MSMGHCVDADLEYVYRRPNALSRINENLAIDRGENMWVNELRPVLGRMS